MNNKRDCQGTRRLTHADLLPRRKEKFICSQFIRHLNLWIDPKLLRDNGIPVVSYEQQLGEMVVVHGLAYHQGENRDEVVGVATNYSSEPLRDCPEGYVECRSGKCFSDTQQVLRFDHLRCD